MGFVVLETNKEKHYIEKELIGHCSVTFRQCEVCGMDHSVLTVYDRKGCLICSLKASKEEVERLCSDIEKGCGKPEDDKTEKDKVEGSNSEAGTGVDDKEDSSN